MTYKKLVQGIAEQMHLTPETVDRVFQGLGATITVELAQGGEVPLLRLGRFRMVCMRGTEKLSGRTCSSPRRKIYFRPSRVLKRQVAYLAQKEIDVDKYAVVTEKQGEEKTAGDKATCPNCGTELPDSTLQHCPKCGSKPWEKKQE